MPVRSKFRPTETKVETKEQGIIRKYMELFGCDIREARMMYREFVLKTQLSRVELYS
jgi:hypothetical protein